MPSPGMPLGYLLTSGHSDWGGRADRWSETIKTRDIIWRCLWIIFTYFMQQIYFLSCCLNIDTLKHSKGRFQFMRIHVKWCRNGCVCSYFTICTISSNPILKLIGPKVECGIYYVKAQGEPLFCPLTHLFILVWKKTCFKKSFLEKN